MDVQLVVPEEAVYGDFFGREVALDGDRALIGAFGREVDNVANAGRAYVYHRDPDGRWRVEARLAAPEPGDRDNFGMKLALNGDVAVVSACMRDAGGAADAGAVEVYRAGARGWVHEATLRAPEPSPMARFGFDVAVWDGWLAVGAHGETTPAGRGSGAVYLYRRTNTGWVLDQRLDNPTLTPGALFGQALAGDGNHLVIGSNDDHGGMQGTGAVYVYDRVDGRFEHVATLVHPPGWSQSFGSSVALDQDRVVVGAYYDATPEWAVVGTAYVFRRDAAGGYALEATLHDPDPGPNHAFGIDVAADRGRVLVGGYGAGTGGGAAWLFAAESGWAPIATLAPRTAEEGDPLESGRGVRPPEEFGFSVALSGSHALVGAPGDRTVERNVATGSAHVFSGADPSLP